MMDYERIVKCVDVVKNRYGDHADPREILTDKIGPGGILEMPMGTDEEAIKGFILKSSRMITVGVNTDLPLLYQMYVLYHETGHLLLGHLNLFRAGNLQDRSFGYRSDNTQLSRLENGANFFLSDYVLDTGDTLEVIHEYDIQSAARILHVPVELLDYKLRLLHWTGRLERYQDYLSVKSDCMGHMEIADYTFE